MTKLPALYEELLLAIHAQQWPRLRRDFSYRTRRRGAEAGMDLEVVERTSDAGQALDVLEKDWVSFLAEDIANPDVDFRSFLNAVGAEIGAWSRRRGVLDADLATPDRSFWSTRRRDSDAKGRLPGPVGAEELERTLFGLASSGFNYAQWPANEADRIALAIQAGNNVDFGEGRRLVLLARSEAEGPEVDRSAANARGRANPAADSTGVSLALDEMDLESLSMVNVEALVSGVARPADRSSATAIALSPSPHLAPVACDVVPRQPIASQKAVPFQT